MFSAEPYSVARARTLRRRGSLIVGVAIGLASTLAKLSYNDELPFLFPTWAIVVVIALAAVVAGVGHHVLQRGKQFEALAEADQVFRLGAAADSVVDDAAASARVAETAPAKGARASRPTPVRFEREPVLYLRPFAEDAREGTGLSSIFDPPSEDHTSSSLEEQLSNAVERIGPLIAIGKPGEQMPTPGAVRLYAGNEWQLTVLSWMAQARLVILRPGDSPGVSWEIDAALSTVRPEKLLLLVVRMRRKRYEATRALWSKHGIVLPAFAEVASMGRASAFFALDQQRRVEAIPLVAPFWRGPGKGLWHKRFHYALRRYYARHDEEWVEPPIRTGLIVNIVMLALLPVVAFACP